MMIEYSSTTTSQGDQYQCLVQGFILVRTPSELLDKWMVLVPEDKGLLKPRLVTLIVQNRYLEYAKEGV